MQVLTDFNLAVFCQAAKLNSLPNFLLYGIYFQFDMVQGQLIGATMTNVNAKFFR